MIVQTEEEDPEELSIVNEKLSIQEGEVAAIDGKKNNQKKISQYYRLKPPPKLINQNDDSKLKN